MDDKFGAALLRPQRQWPLWLILGLAALWAGVLIQRGVPTASLMTAATNLFLALISPVLVALFIVSLLRTSQRNSDAVGAEQRLGDATAGAFTLEQQLHSIESALQSCAEQTARLAAAASDKADGLVASANRLSDAGRELGEAGTAADGVTTRLIAALPELVRVQSLIAEVGGRLDSETVRHLEVINALLASVGTRGDEISTQADVAIASLTRQLADVDETSRETTSRIAKRAYALDAAVDGALARASGLIDSVATRIADSMAALDERLAKARAELVAISNEGATTLGDRVDSLHAAALALGATFTACEQQNAAMQASVEHHLAEGLGQLASARDDTAAAIAALIARTDTLRANVDSLTVPLSTSDATLVAFGERMGRLSQAAEKFQLTLASSLPVAANQLGQLETTSATLDTRVAHLHTAIAGSEVATRAIGDLVAGLRSEVAALGEDDLRRVDDRMSATAAVMNDIGRQIAVFGRLSGTTRTRIETDLAALDHRLGLAHEEGTAKLATLLESVRATHDAMDDLVTPATRPGQTVASHNEG